MKKNLVCLFFILLLTFTFSCEKEIANKNRAVNESASVGWETFSRPDVTVATELIEIEPSSGDPLTGVIYDYKAFEQAVVDGKKEEKNAWDFDKYIPLELDPSLQEIEVSYSQAANETKPNSAQNPLVDLSREGSLLVIDFGPKGELSNEMTRKADVFIVFSQPMVSLQALGSPIEDFSSVKISPEVEGVFRWYGSKMLNFEAKEPLAPSVVYEITVDDQLTSLTNQKLAEPFTFSFKTQGLELVSCSPYSGDKDLYIQNMEVPLNRPMEFLLLFSYPVELDEIEDMLILAPKSLEILDARRDDENGGDANYQSRSAIIRLKNNIPEDTHFSIRLKTDKEKYKFKSYPPFYLIADKTFASSSRLRLNFSLPLDIESVKGNILFSIPVEDLEDKVGVGYRMVVVTGLKVPYQSSYQVTLKEGISDIYGRKLGKTVTVDVKLGDAPSYANFQGSGYRFLEWGFPANNLFEYQNILRSFRKIEKVSNPIYYKLPKLQEVAFENPLNELVFEVDDFSSYLNKGGKGAVYVGREVEYEYSNWKKEKKTRRDEGHKIIQVTDLGVTARFGYNGAIVWVKSLSTGMAVVDAKVQIISARGKKKRVVTHGVTDKDGILILQFDGDYSFSDSNKMWGQVHNQLFAMEGFVVQVEKGDDSIVFVPSGGHNRWDFAVYNTRSPKNIATGEKYNLCFTDRGLYKPGEELKFRGIVQEKRLGEYSPFQGEFKISVQKGGHEAKPFYSSQGELSLNGGYYGSVRIPEDAEPGSYWIDVTLSGDEYPKRISFQVSEFKRAEFEVLLEDSLDNLVAGDLVDLKGTGRYLSGGVMENRDYSAFWILSQGVFRPELQKYQNYEYGYSASYSQKTLDQEKGKLSVSGEVNLSLRSQPPEAEGVTQNYYCELSVMDQSQQSLVAKKNIRVHPSDFYLGLRVENGVDGGWWSRYLPVDQAIDFEGIALTPDETLFSSRVAADVQILRYEWKQVKEEGVDEPIYTDWKRDEVEVKRGVMNIGRRGKGAFSFTPKRSGAYEIVVRAKDSKDRGALTRFDFFVVGGDWGNWFGDDPDRIELTPEKEFYQPGEVARVLMKSPLERGEYLLTIEREGLLDEKLIFIDSQVKMLEIPVKEEYFPVFYLAVSSSSSRMAPPPTTQGVLDSGKPKSYFGMTPIKVESDVKDLDVSMEFTKEKYLPGDQAMVKLSVTKDGKAVPNAECTFLVVDRGVLDLIEYQIPQPIDFFYSVEKFHHGVEGGDSRAYLENVLAYAGIGIHSEVPVAGEGGIFMEYDEALKSDSKENARGPSIRSDYNPMAVFEPMVLTDENGVAIVSFPFPDTLTTYRATAFVVKENQFGYEEEELAVTNAVTVRTAAPQSLRLRDQAQISLILTNQTARDWDFKLGVSSDRLKIVGESQRKIRLKGGESKVIPFDFIALKEGEALVDFAIQSKILNEVVREKLDVLSHSVMEAFTVVGTTKEGAESLESLVLPSFAEATAGGLALSFSHNPFTMVDTRVDFLEESSYLPYSVEDLFYRTLPSLLFEKDLQKVAPSTEYDKKAILNLIATLKKSQYKDGGFSYYDSFDFSSPSLSLLMGEGWYWSGMRGNAILGKKEKEQLHRYLISLESEKSFSKENIPYLLYVRSLMGENISSKLDKLSEKDASYSLAQLLYVGLGYLNGGDEKEAREVLEQVKNRVKEGTQSIELVETYEKRSLWEDDSLNFSLFLRLYYELNSMDDYFYKIANSLTQYQKNALYPSRYATFQYLIMAFKVSENDSNWMKSASAKVVLGEKEFYSVKFEKGNPANLSAFFPLNEPLLKSYKRDVQLPLLFSKEKKSDENYYYAATLEYGLPCERVEERDEGIGVFAEIETLEGSPIQNDLLVLGKTYRMKVLLTSSRDRSNLALSVPLPSGCEAVNSDFITTGSYGDQGGVDHYSQEVEVSYGDRKERVPFENLPLKGIGRNSVFYRFYDFEAGQARVEFLFRATSAGKYPTPPVSAQLVDEPEVFGRTAGKIYTIK